MSGQGARSRLFYARPPVRELPELASLGRDTVRRAGAPFLAPHAHATMELCYIERGVVTWWVGSELHEVRGGHVYVTWPDELHGGLHGVLHPCTLSWLGIPLWPGGSRAGRTFLHLPPAEARLLVRRLRLLPRRVFPVPPSIGAAWRELLEAVATPPGAPRTLRLRAALLEILLTVTEAARTEAAREPSRLVQEAAGVLDSTLDRRVPVAELARRLASSPSRVHHRFRAELGIPPAEWHLRRRITEACRRLERGDETITEIALELGFGSSQYFATAFRRVTGLSPREFRTGVRRAR